MDNICSSELELFFVSVCSVEILNILKDIRQNSRVKTELRELYPSLCNDDTPMVRMAASAKLGDFFQVMEAEYIINDYMKVFLSLARDDQVENLIFEIALNHSILG